MKNKKFSGFTLIEIIVVVIIIGIIGIAIYDFFINNYKTIQDEAQITQTETQAKKIEDRIKQWLQMADQSSIFCSSNNKTITMTVYDDPSNVNGNYIKIWYDDGSKKINIQKNAATPEFYLEGKVVDFKAIDNFPQITVEFKVNMGVRNIIKDFKIVHNRRAD